MNRRNFIRKTVGAAAVGIGAGAFPSNLFASEDYVTITILHTNDIHSHIEPFYRNKSSDMQEMAE